MNQEKSSSGSNPPKVYTEEFKRSVVDYWCHSDKTAAQMAQEFGVKVWNVRDWRRRYGPTHKPVDAPIPQSFIIRTEGFSMPLENIDGSYSNVA